MIGLLLTILLILVVAALLIGWIAMWPLALLWVLNTLFHLNLAYSLLNWLAAFVFIAIIGGAFAKARS